MIDPLDDRTDPLPLGNRETSPATPPTAPPPEADPNPAANVLKLQSSVLPDEQKLNAEFDLVRIHAPVYMLDKKAAAKRTAGAERVEKHRRKLAAEGLRPAAVPGNLLDAVKTAGGWTEWQAQITASATAEAVPPPEILDEVKAAGGWSQWQAQKAVAAVPPPLPSLPETPKPTIVERIVEVKVPAMFSQNQETLMNLGRSVRQLSGWRRALAQMALGSAVVIPPKK